MGELAINSAVQIGSRPENFSYVFWAILILGVAAIISSVNIWDQADIKNIFPISLMLLGVVLFIAGLVGAPVSSSIYEKDKRNWDKQVDAYYDSIPVVKYPVLEYSLSDGGATVIIGNPPTDYASYEVSTIKLTNTSEPYMEGRYIPDQDNDDLLSGMFEKVLYLPSEKK